MSRRTPARGMPSATARMTWALSDWTALQSWAMSGSICAASWYSSRYRAVRLVTAVNTLLTARRYERVSPSAPGVLATSSRTAAAQSVASSARVSAAAAAAAAWNTSRLLPQARYSVCKETPAALAMDETVVAA